VSTAADIVDWLIAQPPSDRASALQRHPDTLPLILAQAREELAKMSPLGLATVVDEGHRSLPHLDYLDSRLVRAVRKVEAGESQFIRISMPPRSGKSVSTSEYLPLWVLQRHPDWRVGLISHSPSLAAGWGRQIRRMVEDDRLHLGLTVASDAGSVTDWETSERGGVSSRSVGQSITGRGFKVIIVDDVVKDYADAASETKRLGLREWWQTTARTRLEPPSLTVVIGTRWHEDDFTGWVDTAGDPFEVIVFPAIADEDDVLGRHPGDPLYSPFIVESREEALARWADTEQAVGPYAWSALFQQRPQPVAGAIFMTSWWRYWTRNPDLVSDTCILFNPLDGQGLEWLDSWDLAVQAKETADWSVGQRWVIDGQGHRFLIGQARQRTEFTETLATMRYWATPESLGGTGRFVHKRLVEQASNGFAIIDTLKRELPGVIGVVPRGSKEVRARAITPEIATGYVYLPHPSEPGNEWVLGLVGELASFPTGKNDDQVDALSQALASLRVRGTTTISNPGDRAAPLAASSRRIIDASRTGVRRSSGG
jgi:predicted phage terminase large subunit-like protein